MLERESGGTADEYFYRRFEISDLLIEKAISMKNETITLTNSDDLKPEDLAIAFEYIYSQYIGNQQDSLIVKWWQRLLQQNAVK